MILPMLMHKVHKFAYQAAQQEMFNYFQNCSAAYFIIFSPRSDNGNDQN